MADLVSFLTEQGFVGDAAAVASGQVAADEAGLNAGGAFTLMHAFTKGAVSVEVQQNTASEDVGGYSAVVTHPAVAVISSPKGRAAFNPDDLAVAGTLIAELS